MIVTFLEYTIISLEIIAVLIIIIGVVKMLHVFGTCIIKRIPLHNLMTEIRIGLSDYLILSLEVFIGRDVIETLLSPTVNDIVILVVLVLLRTLLAFFLNYEASHITTKNLHKVIKEKV